VTTGGSTSGRWTKPSTRALPGKRPRAKAQATAIATGSDATVAIPPTFSDRKIAVHSSAV